MESNRAGYRLSRCDRPGRQRGITAIGFLILAAVFGTVGLAAIKVFPLYMEKMRVGRVLENLEKDLLSGTTATTREGIRNMLSSRFYVENLDISTFDVETTQKGQGFELSVTKETEAPFVADLYFVVKIDEQVELPR